MGSNGRKKCPIHLTLTLRQHNFHPVTVEGSREEASTCCCYFSIVLWLLYVATSFQSTSSSVHPQTTYVTAYHPPLNKTLPYFICIELQICHTIIFCLNPIQTCRETSLLTLSPCWETSLTTLSRHFPFRSMGVSRFDTNWKESKFIIYQDKNDYNA